MRRNIVILINTFVFSALIWLYVNLNLTYVYSINVPFDIKSSKTQGISSDVPDNLEVTVKGKGWEILKLMASKDLAYRLDLSAFKKDTRLDLYQNISDVLNLPHDLSVVGLNPPFLEFSFDNIVTRLVKVKNNTSVITKEGYMLIGSGKLSPDSVSVTGANSIVSKIRFLNTDAVVFRDVNSSFTKQVKLMDTLGNVVRIEPRTVSISYKIELSAEKVFDDISVEISGAGTDKEILLIPPKIKISLRGGVEELSRLNPQDIRVYVNFKSIEKDEQGFVTPTIELPEQFSVINAEPQKFQYIIKKKASEN